MKSLVKAVILLALLLLAGAFVYYSFMAGYTALMVEEKGMLEYSVLTVVSMMYTGIVTGLMRN